MADLTLAPQSPLGGYAQTVGGVTIAEVTDLALVSAAVPLGGDAAFAKALVDGFGAARPATGQASPGRGDGVCVLGLQPDQVMILFPFGDIPSPDAAQSDMGAAAYVTDQSDGWAFLRVEGTDVSRALERICMLDLADGAFPVGTVARTVMEHLAVIILREAPDRFLLMSPRSSARSFLHAVETSARNIA